MYNLADILFGSLKVSSGNSAYIQYSRTAVDQIVRDRVH